MSDKITADTIIQSLKDKVENKEAQFDANFWIEAAMKLNLLLGDETDILAELHQELAKLELVYFESQEKRNVSEAKLRVETSEEFKRWKKQDNKIRQIEEFVRIAKKMSDVAGGF